MAGAEHPKNLYIYSELRPRKSRSKTGCFPCRTRRKKCGEAQPIWQQCVRLGLMCSWPKDSSAVVSQSNLIARLESAPMQSLQQSMKAQEMGDPDIVSSGLVEDEVNAGEINDTLLIELQQLTAHFRAAGIELQEEIVDFDTRTYILQNEGSEAAMLFDHFCNKTAPWLINGHGYDNPILKFIVPLIKSDELILNVVMAVSGVHLLCSMPSIEPLVSKYYSGALRTLRKRLSAWADRSDPDYKPIFAAIIVLCHHELISGNTYGAALQHLRGCQEFIPVACEDIQDPTHQDFLVFLLEHFGFHMLIANVRHTLQEVNIMAALHFSKTVLPLIQCRPGFGSIFAFEPQCLVLIPQIALLSWQRNQPDSALDDPAWEMTYTRLVERLNHGRDLMVQSDGIQPSEIQSVISIKVNTLLMLLHASYHGRERDRSQLISLLQPLANDTIRMLVDVDERDACFGLYWSLLVTGTYVRDRASQDLLIQKLRSNQSSMYCFTRGIELLERLWNEQEGPNFGLEGLELTAFADGVDVCIC